MKKTIFLITTCLPTFIGNSQVLLNEDFNNYPTGHLNTDYTGATAGQGGWVTRRYPNTSANVSATAMVTPETGKGNVVSFTTNGNFPGQNENVVILQNAGVISALWNNRTVGNNVLKYEYEVYGAGWFNAYSGTFFSTSPIIRMHLVSSSNYSIETIQSVATIPFKILKNYTATTFPYNMWLKVELFVDYDNKKFYSYIPTLNLFVADVASSSLPLGFDNIWVVADNLKPGAIVKYDNIKLTALPSVPAYILSANEMVSAKFSMYPNPATNVVHISNSENMLVEQVTVYDSTGKELSQQNFNNESQIQLSVENLASGTYILQIKTNAGLAVKKFIKK